MTDPFEKDISTPNLGFDDDNIMPMESLLTRIDHVGIAVPDLDVAIAFYERTFGLSVVHEEVNERQGVREAMLRVGDSGSCIQLLAPLDATSTIAKFLDRSGPGIQQVAYGVDDVVEASARLRAAGVRLLYDEPQVGTAGSLVNFCHPKDCGGVLVELVQAASVGSDGGFE
jgi:methylmalonyl-CoA/ethylmalonyl-CoA epimerase